MISRATAVLALAGSAAAFAPMGTPALRKPAGMQMSAQVNAAKVAIAGAALLIATPAFAGDGDAGEKIFNANCAACHAGGQNSVVPTIAGAALLIATPAFAGDGDAGEKIFNANCAACHAGGQNSVVPTIAGAALLIATPAFAGDGDAGEKI
eukprot:CAMPEP_0173076940 /NCGR_PEP_ID=MMETSP1102-20130122/12817_1 /TAXON_ID=49646 /ORGANISM="Geminigera sp., Strain Caron Lab Isolate" /LENGTH=151 /DNA_ID=CAMNT_0013947107 /DNA_START=26 /DNA_END=483 /DNA_ORIENTATION=+